jgi:hypothetical protein
MNTKQSTIRKWFAGKKEVADAGRSARFVSRLGDVKVETKTTGATEHLDGPDQTDRYPPM